MLFAEEATRTYQQLQEELIRLHHQPVRDWLAIDEVMVQLDREQRRLKSQDGQHGNNSIEWRHGEPPESER